MNSNLLLAFDFGGTKLTAALANTAVFSSPSPSWLDHRRAYSAPGATAESDLQTMIRLGHELLTGSTPLAIGVSFGGPVEFETGIVRLSHHVQGWENTPLQALLQAQFGVPVRVDNDANVAALGEHQFGAGRGYHNLLYITISTGVGGGWILNGRSWHGSGSMAGEIGHMVADPNGPLCLCGKQGCVERLASGPYMAQAWLEAHPAHPNKEITGKQVAEMAAQGDKTAQTILQRGAWAVGVGIGNAANLINPQLFVLGGGVTKSGKTWWHTVHQVARQTALPEVQFHIVPAQLGDDAPLWGAIALVREIPAIG